jgi:glycosyltransferase involved in cell wall biosynthesis
LNKVGVVLGCPISIGVGGFLRTYHVLPYLSKCFAQEGVSLLVLPQANFLLWATKILVSTGYTVDGARSYIVQSMKEASRYCELPMQDIETVLDYACNLSVGGLNSNPTLNRVLTFGPLSSGHVKEVEGGALLRYRTLAGLTSERTAFLYSTSEALETMWMLESISRKIREASCGVMLQVDVFSSTRSPSSVRDARYFSDLVLGRPLGSIYERLIRLGRLRLLLSVSISPLISSGMLRTAREHGCAIGVPRPANAFDSAIKWRNASTSRGPTAIYFARLGPSKGLHEIPSIWGGVNRLLPEAKLKVAGAFEGRRNRDRFFSSIKELGVRNIEYLGYLERGRLLKELSEVKVLVYPTHLDSFSLVALEALASGAAVVAYGIPAMASVYGGLPSVSLVEEGDMASMAMEVARVLRMDDRSFGQMKRDQRLERFLELHSSWENVAESEFSYLRLLLHRGTGPPEEESDR